VINKHLQIFILLFFVSATGFAQKFHGGLSLGLVASQVAGDTYSGYNKAGIYGGAYVSFDFGQRSALQLELTYFQKGSRENPDSLNNFTSYIFRANYVELPLFYQYKVNRFTVEIGPSAGFLLGYSEEMDQLPVNLNPPALITIQINLGIRYDINNSWGVDFRTNNSLLNIRKNNVTGDIWRLVDYGQYHDALVLSVFYKLK